MRIDAHAHLDHYPGDILFVEDASQYSAQRTVFEYFLTAARDQGKIVNLHISGAEAEVLALLSGYRIRRAIVHWYAGPADILRALAPRGAYFTVGVEVLFSSHIQSIARDIPTSRLSSTRCAGTHDRTGRASRKTAGVSRRPGP